MDKATPLAAIGLISTLIFACGGTPPPTTQLADARSALGAAEAVGAVERPAAALHFKLARDAIERAKKRMDDGENDLAARELARAKVDAELAEMLARFEDTRLRADHETARLLELDEGGGAFPSSGEPFPSAGEPFPSKHESSPAPMMPEPGQALEEPEIEEENP